MRFSQIIPLLLSVPAALASPTPVEKRNGCTTGISAAEKARVQNAFLYSGVVPTLIPSIDPQVKVSAAYGAKAVDLGNQFLTTETLTQPSLSFTAEPGKDAEATTYSYFLVDPDVPSPEGLAGVRVNFLHWYVSGAKSICASSQSPQTVAFYQPLTPASPTQHRYTFLVYREPAGYKPDALTPQTRVAFDVNGYAAKGGLTLIGGNFLREAITNGVLPS